MSGFQDTLNNLFPTSWLDPYGCMPLNRQTGLSDERPVQIDITQVQTDDGIKVTAIKTPPHASAMSITDAINMALGMNGFGDNCEGDGEKPKEEGGQRQDRQDDDGPESESSEDHAKPGEKTPKTGHSSPPEKFAGLKTA